VHSGVHISQLFVSNFKEMLDRKPTGDDKVPVNVTKMLGEDDLRILTQLIDDIFEV